MVRHLAARLGAQLVADRERFSATGSPLSAIPARRSPLAAACYSTPPLPGGPPPPSPLCPPAAAATAGGAQGAPRIYDYCAPRQWPQPVAQLSAGASMQIATMAMCMTPGLASGVPFQAHAWQPPLPSPPLPPRHAASPLAAAAEQQQPSVVSLPVEAALRAQLLQLQGQVGELQGKLELEQRRAVCEAAAAREQADCEQAALQRQLQLEQSRAQQLGAELGAAEGRTADSRRALGEQARAAPPPTPPLPPAVPPPPSPPW